MNNVACNFSHILNRVVFKAYKTKSPLAKDKGELVVGDLIIVRDGRYYNICHKDSKEILYFDIAMVEAALLIARFHQLNDYNKLREIKILENTYSKHYTDMQYYTNAHASARTANDYDMLAVTETRYQDARMYAREAKSRIKRICSRMR